MYQKCLGLENCPMFWWCLGSGPCCGRDCTGARAELGHSSELGLWLAGLRLRLGPDWSVLGSLTGGWPSLSPRAGSSWLWSWTQLATVSHIDIISDQNNKTQGTPSDILLITQWYSIRLVIRLNTELIDWNIGDKKQWKVVRTILITTWGNLVYTKPANSFYWEGFLQRGKQPTRVSLCLDISHCSLCIG